MTGGKPIGTSKSLLVFTSFSALLIQESSSFLSQNLQSFGASKPATKLSYSAFDEVQAQFLHCASLNMDEHISLEARNLVCKASEYISDNQSEVESILVEDISFVALDFSIFTSFPEQTAVLRLINFIGRLLSIWSDYLPNHSHRPDEFAFKMILLCTSVWDLSRSTIPKLKTFIGQDSKFLPDRRDVIAYRKIFEPAGFTWSQLKVLFSSGALIWEEVTSSDLYFLNQDQGNHSRTNLYWMYNNFTKTFDAPKKTWESADFHFFGQLENKSSRYSHGVQPILPNYDLHEALSQYTNKVNNRTVLLSIDNEKLIELIEDDKQFFLPTVSLIVSNKHERFIDQVLPTTTEFSVLVNSNVHDASQKKQNPTSTISSTLNKESQDFYS